MQQSIKKSVYHIKQKLTAILFLGCLLLAVTPKHTLHQLFANHTDAAYADSHQTAPINLNKDSIHCHFDSLFTVNNYYILPATTVAKPQFTSFLKQVFLQPELISTKNITTLLRGPPALDDFNLS